MAQGMNKLSKKGLAAQKGKKAHAKASSKRTAAKKGSEYETSRPCMPLSFLLSASLAVLLYVRTYACDSLERQ